MGIGSESESVSPKSRSRENIQDVTLSPWWYVLRERSRIKSLTTVLCVNLLQPHTMHYNELKIRILRLFESTGELDSVKIRERLAKEKALRLTDKAVEMALMRYWRQGLLSRTRRLGMFQYSLTERGLARKEWLLKNQ